MTKYIESKILQKEIKTDLKSIKQKLMLLAFKQGGGTVAIKVEGLDFLFFTKQANGRRNIFKVGGIKKGSYTTLEIK